jgi:hypothetical protein
MSFESECLEDPRGCGQIFDIWWCVGGLYTSVILFSTTTF